MHITLKEELINTLLSLAADCQDKCPEGKKWLEEAAQVLRDNQSKNQSIYFNNDFATVKQLIHFLLNMPKRLAEEQWSPADLQIATQIAAKAAKNDSVRDLQKLPTKKQRL